MLNCFKGLKKTTQKCESATGNNLAATYYYYQTQTLTSRSLFKVVYLGA